MAKHNETGIKGEEIAEKFLLTKGYTIRYKNWRHGQKEIDIIAQLNQLLVFIEVKTRSNIFFGQPEDAVDYKKQDFMKTAAEEFLYQHKEYEQIRFDIISIVTQKGKLHEIVHFEDAFF